MVRCSKLSMYNPGADAFWPGWRDSKGQSQKETTGPPAPAKDKPWTSKSTWVDSSRMKMLLRPFPILVLTTQKRANILRVRIMDVARAYKWDNSECTASIVLLESVNQFDLYVCRATARVIIKSEHDNNLFSFSSGVGFSTERNSKGKQNYN